jgi:DNA-binding IclR family transcriptional regulator
VRHLVLFSYLKFTELAGSRELDSGVAESADNVGDRTAVFRTVAVIDLLARADPHGVGVRELASATGISRSAAHRVLTGLTQLGYARQLPSERYEPGALALAWTALTGDRLTIEEAVQGALTELSAKFDETALAASYGPEAETEIVYRAVAPSSKPVRYILDVGSRAPLYAGASGKAVLAYLPDSLIDELELVGFQPQTVTDPRKLRADLARIRASGVAWSFGERIAEAVGCAAPVFRASSVAGSISLTVPGYRFEESQRDAIGAAVVAAAATATGLLTAAPRPLVPGPPRPAVPGDSGS